MWAPMSRRWRAPLLLMCACLCCCSAAAATAFAGTSVGPPGSVSRAWTAPAALSAAECQAIIAHGTQLVDSTVVSRRPGATAEISGPAHLRTTLLQWLPRGVEMDWLYERVLALAQHADKDAGWNTLRLS